MKVGDTLYYVPQSRPEHEGYATITSIDGDRIRCGSMEFVSRDLQHWFSAPRSDVYDGSAWASKEAYEEHQEWHAAIRFMASSTLEFKRKIMDLVKLENKPEGATHFCRTTQRHYRVGEDKSVHVHLPGYGWHLERVVYVSELEELP